MYRSMPVACLLQKMAAGVTIVTDTHARNDTNMRGVSVDFAWPAVLRTHTHYNCVRVVESGWFLHLPLLLLLLDLEQIAGKHSRQAGQLTLHCYLRVQACDGVGQLTSALEYEALGIAV